MLKNYIKLAFKVMLRKKYFTFLTLVGISFTIMIITITAAFIDQIVGASDTEPNRGRTLVLKEVFLMKDDRGRPDEVSLPFLQRYITTLRTPERISIYRDGGYVSARNGVPRAHRLKYSDENFWSITNFKFLEGRPFDARQVKNASRVVVISEELKDYYFGEGNAAGKIIELFGIPFRVIGVVKSAPLLSDAGSDAWIPYTADPAPVPPPAEWPTIHGQYKAMLLARSGEDAEKVKAEIDARMRKIVPPNPQFTSVKANALTALQHFAKVRNSDPDPDFAQLFTALFACLFLFLLIPVISLINLNISRISERAAEIGVRKSFGASSSTLAGQFIVENIILTLTGGLIGVILAYLFSDALILMLNAFDPLFQISFGQFILSWRVVAFCIGCCCFFGFLSGVYPAYRMSKMHPVNALKGNNL
ncbi:putative ABC transport system permease protein [Daejeonella lutea]|uniref:Putative ABC transport system permease protein n=2 Tax=Daejeonella lutea TaxID=572036 RepID=A0A1T5BR07_9SPHI|nr:putative ABC transport system permease protein [Daejeonella lutea]